MQYSIAIDIGTTTVKCVLFGPGPSVIAEANKEYKTIMPRPSWAEQNPEDWWNGAVYGIKSVLAKSGVAAADIKVISVSSQAPCVLPVDKEGKALHNAMIWMDRRSREEVDMLAEKIGEERIFDITGNKLDSYFALSETMWMVRHCPEIVDKTYKFLQVNGYVNMKLTGEFTIDGSHMSLVQICDIRKRDWSDELLTAIGLDRSKMPRIVNCCEPIGHVSREAAALTGLSTDTVVLAGAVDATAAALEVGVYKDGRVAEVTGTSSLVLVGHEKLVTTKGLSYLEGIYPNTVVLFGPMNTAGGSLKWFRDNLFGGETPDNNAYDLINKEIEAGAKDPSKIIYLPYLSGERAPIWDPDARGCFIGLNMETSRAQIERAVMEGTCFALLDNLNEAYNIGISKGQLLSFGGCTKSDIWLKIKASVIDQQIAIPSVNQGATGGLANINAAYMGEFASAEEACMANLKITKVIDPTPAWVPVYKEMFAIYKDSYAALKEQFKRLAKI